MINLNKEILTRIIKAFGKEDKIFQSEAQFQFDLAWELQKNFPNCQVKLEDMRSYVKKDEKEKNSRFKKKFYTDIVLEDDDYSIAIELKYKTAEYYDKNKCIYLFEHGAVDLGRYDYLWDVHRIELLTGKGNNEELFGRVEVQNKCKKGYAVLLTNDEKYWTQSYVNKNETMDNQFKIGDKTHILYNKDLDWRKLKENDEKYRKNYQHYPTTILKKNGTPSERAQPIHLSKQYDYQWEDYCPLHNNEKFRFVIIEVL